MKKTRFNVFTEETLKYVQKYVAPEGLKVLEVGCGAGDFGLELIRAGAGLTALDTDENAVESAIAKGVNALHQDFLSYDADPFDVIIFTRSLHHIHHLDKAMNHSKSLLKRGGKLIIEDFDLEMVDLATTRWYYDMISILCTAVDKKEPSSYVSDVLRAWEEEHQHSPPLHSGAKMIQGVEKHFAEVVTSRNAYLYRSIGSLMEDDGHGFEIAKKLLEIENGLIGANLILPCGLRIVAENRV